LYWPCLRSHDRYAAWSARRFLESCFAIRRKRTLAIVGAALGSWIGGDQISWLLKSASLRARYSFSVFAPGNNHAEIIDIITEVEPRVDQIILFLCSSYIRYLQLRAESLGKTLPLSKLRYMVLGESIPERVRMSLQARAGVPPQEPFMLSFYGSADTGMLGIESPSSVALRKLLTLNEGLAAELGFSEPVPHLFHYCAPDTYLETIDGELCVTRWQGIPIVRYNLHDKARLYRWRTLRGAVLKSNLIQTSDGPLREVVRKSRTYLPDLIAVEGRTDALILGGSNFSEAILDEVVRTTALESVLTGMYKVRLGLRDGQQVFEFDLELRPGVTLDAEAADRVYDALIQALCRVQPEFRSDWENIYRAFDRDPSRRILQLQWHPWPVLSREVEALPKRSSIQR
jgi:phenylacetate-CoA ligase